MELRILTLNFLVLLSQSFNPFLQIVCCALESRFVLCCLGLYILKLSVAALPFLLKSKLSFLLGGDASHPLRFGVLHGGFGLLLLVFNSPLSFLFRE